MRIIKVPSLKTATAVHDAFAGLGYDLTANEDPSPIMARAHALGNRTVGNRFAILPMEGWDAEASGHPSELLTRRWLNFAKGGAKLLWGCEAAAVEHRARANPNQLVIDENTIESIASLYGQLRHTHAEHHGSDHDLLVGLQLTHSGRWCRPDGMPSPAIMYRYPALDRRVDADDAHLLTDDELDRLVDVFVDRARLVQQVGFDFVDIKHCHGYLLHEALGATSRPGRYGGSFLNRTRFLRDVTNGIRTHAPGLEIGVRLSAYDMRPFHAGATGTGEPVPDTSGYRFGGDATGLEVDLGETIEFLALLDALDIRLVCITAGSPYYNPHIQRPARYPPSDGYQPPEDPLIGVARMITATRQLKQRFPHMTFVGSGYSYLQEWLPSVAAAEIARGGTDLVGIGRMALSYPDMPADVIGGKPLARKKLCRTFSDCTTAPRQGLVSGCYPLDDFYGQRPEAIRLKDFKRTGR